MFKIFCSILLVFDVVFPQTESENAVVKRDTSFTVYSSYIKESKKFPFITIAQSQLDKGLSFNSNVEYASYGKRKLHLDIVYPMDNSKLYHGVILVHGGGWRSGDKSQQIPIAIALAKSGLVAAAVEYRLSPEALYPAAIIDLKSAVRWMRANSEKYNIDTNKIVALGCSSGGHLVSMLGVTNGNTKFKDSVNYPDHSSSVQAVINIDGILDFTNSAESGKDDDPENPSVGKLWLGYTYKDNPEIWREASPVNYVDQNTPPFLFINSSIDRFHAGRDTFIEELDNYKTYHDLKTFPDTPHSFWFFHPWFNPMINKVIGFLDKIF